jgi:hypothetical protein
MSADDRTEPVTAASVDRRLVRVSGVLAMPGGWVTLVELVDGWVLFPDRRTRYRRWQVVCAVGLVVVLGSEWLLQHGYGPVSAEAVLGLVGFGLLVLIFVIGQVGDDRAAGDRRRLRRESLRRAGGRSAVRQSVRHLGRARTVGGMNVALSSLGRADPVYSTSRVRGVEVRRRWWQTVVDVDLKNGHRVTYRARGIRGPLRLARVFDGGAALGRR